MREALITSSVVYLGAESNLLHPGPDSCRRIKLRAPVLTVDELQKLKTINIPGFKAATLPILFDAGGGGKSLEEALDALFVAAAKAIGDGANILILSDRGIDARSAAIPALLAVGGLHHYLIREGLRTKASIVLESGEPREIHHFSCLVGYGAAAVNPYMALDSVAELVRSGYIAGFTEDKAVHTYLKVANKGVIKVLSKMGIFHHSELYGRSDF